MQQLGIDEAAAQTSLQMLTPGFGMFGGPGGVGTPDVNDGFQEQKLDTILTREAAARNEIEQFSIAS